LISLLVRFRLVEGGGRNAGRRGSSTTSEGRAEQAARARKWWPAGDREGERRR
jgi:hypothetical protein